MTAALLIPEGWVATTLGELALWGSGGTPRRSEPSYFQGDIPWVTISDLNDDLVKRTYESISQLGLENSSAKLVSPGSVMVALYGSIGKLGIATQELATNQAIAYAIPDDLAFDSRYLFHLLRSQRDQLAAVGSGVTQKNIYLGDLKAFRTLLAPRAEQTRIVEKLEELLSDLDAGVAELKAAQKKLAQYRQSLLKAAVEGALTAEWRKGQAAMPAESGAALLARILAERRSRWQARQLAKFKEQGKNPPRDWQAKYPEPVAPDSVGLPALPFGWVWVSIDQLSPDDLANGRSVLTAESGAKVLRLTAVKHGRIDLDEFKIGAWSVNEAKPFAVVQGDLLIVRGNGSLTLVGRAGMVPKVTEQVAYPDTMIRLRVVESVVRPEWVGLVWDASITRSHLETRARTSAGIYKISQPDIVSVVIPVPLLNEQDQMLSMFKQTSEEMQGVQTMVERGLKQSAAQRKNILQATFSGQLVPQDPADEPASALLARIRAERAEREAGSTKGRGKKKEST